MSLFRFFPLPFALLAATLPAVAGGDPSYEFHDLGTLGGAESVAYGLNDFGQVVGWSTIPGCMTQNGFPCRRAFSWQAGVMVDLGLLSGDEESFARAVNNSGLIVGTSESNVIFGSGTYHAATWSGGVISALADLGAGTSFAYDVNEAGQIVGHAQDPAISKDRAITWQGGSVFNLGATEPHQSNRAYGLSNDGKVAGFAWNLFTPNDSILYDQGWKTIGGSGQFQNSEARDVNDAGVVVGLQAFPSGNWHAAYWTPGAKDPIDAGVLPGLPLGELYDVNESGIAVGRSYADDGSGTSRATIFDGVQLRDLNDFLPAGTGAVLYEAQEINENGDIAGTAVVGGLFHAFLLKAMPEWKAVGTALPGSAGAPALFGFGSLESISPVELRLENTQPAAPFFLVAGVSQLDAPLLGGVLIPSPDKIFQVLFADPKGAASLGFTWPAGVPAGLGTYWQAWIADASGPQGWTATNGLTATAP